MVRTLSLALALSLGASVALANDTTAELKTGGLEFTRSAEISMVEEKLYISPTKVQVDYVYRNTTDQDVETYVAFPMPDITGSGDPMMDAGDSSKDNFLGFSVTQDGAAIKPSLQQRIYSADMDVTDVLAKAKVPFNPLADATRDALAKLPKATVDDLVTRGMMFANSYDDGSGEKTEFVPTWTLKSVYWWKTTFPKGKDIRVSHTYKPSVGGTVATTYLEDDQPKGERYEEYKKKYCIDDNMVKIAQKSNADMNANKPYYYENWISYVLTTGANWNGPIAKFTLIVDKGDPKNYVSFCGTGVKKTGATTFEMHATDFLPEKDLDILLLRPSNAE
jgi:hypothetical protein